MTYPRYEEIEDFPSDASTRREIVSQHHLREALIRLELREGISNGIIYADTKAREVFYFLDPYYYRMPKDPRIRKDYARKVPYTALTGLMIRSDSQGDQERVDRSIAFANI